MKNESGELCTKDSPSILRFFSEAQNGDPGLPAGSPSHLVYSAICGSRSGTPAAPHACAESVGQFRHVHASATNGSEIVSNRERVPVSTDAIKRALVCRAA